MNNKLTIVTDSHTEALAIYLQGRLRAEVDFIDDFTPFLLVECCEMYARDIPLIVEALQIDSEERGVYDEDADEIRWPEQLGELV